MRRILIFVALSISIPALTQMRVCMGGDLDHLSVAEAQRCESQVRLAASSALAASVPPGTRLVVVCGENGWTDYIVFAGKQPGELRAASADFDTATRTLFVRGTRITSQDAADSITAGAFSPATARLHRPSRCDNKASEPPCAP